MSQMVSLPIPDELYEPLQRVARAAHQPLEAVLLKALQTSLPPLDGLPPDLNAELTRLENLDDNALQQVLLGTVPVAQQQELDALLNKNQAEGLSQDEKSRLADLTRTTDRIMLKKARASVLLRFRGRRLDEYFDFIAPDDIRIKGTRIGIESVLYEYVYRESRPEEVAQRFPSLSLESVYAAILYYLQHREKMEAYLADWLEWGKAVREQQERNPPPVVLRLRAAKQAHQVG